MANFRADLILENNFVSQASLCNRKATPQLAETINIEAIIIISFAVNTNPDGSVIGVGISFSAVGWPPVGEMRVSEGIAASWFLVVVCGGAVEASVTADGKVKLFSTP